MTVESASSDTKLLWQDLPAPRRAKSRRTLVWGSLVIALAAAVAIGVSALVIGSERREFEQRLAERLHTIAASRSEVARSWLDNLISHGNRVAHSDFFRVFTEEVRLAGGLPGLAGGEEGAAGEAGEGEAAELHARVPYVRRLLSDFIADTPFLAGYLLQAEAADAPPVLASEGAPELARERHATARAAARTGAAAFGRARAGADGPVFDMALPVFRPQSEERPQDVAGVLLLTVPLAGKLPALASPPPLSRPGESVRIVQRGEDALAVLSPGDTETLRQTSLPPPEGRDSLSFRRYRPAGGEALYAAGAAIPGTEWFTLARVPVDAARAELRRFQAWVAATAAVLLLAVAGAFGAFWFRLVGENNRTLAVQFKDLAGRIRAQREFLERINATVSDLIALKSLDRRYEYVNDAFARAVGRPVEEILGQGDAAVFGEDTARRLQPSDDDALDSGDLVTTQQEVHLRSRRHVLQVSKVPLRNEDGAVVGLVQAAADITAFVDYREQRERAIRQTVEALVTAVELRDPYLAGHSRRLAALAVAVGRQLGLELQDIATLETAANLSQIGKLAIPEELLARAERFSPEERRRLQAHVEFALRVLRGIDFGLPVAETVGQMHERLDGSGYPAGLKDEEIARTARVLGTCDVFCARVEPRAYRRGISAEEAIEILAAHPERYDARVVEALGEVVASPTGDRVLGELGAARSPSRDRS